MQTIKQASKLRVLVTGGAGFIGSHLCERLVGQGHDVYCLDNFDSYYDPKVKKQNLQPLLKQDNFTFIRGDIQNARLVDKLFKQKKFDLVVHLAAKAGVRPSIEKPLDYAKVNLLGTLTILEACHKYQVKKLVFASSSSVYGETKKKLFSEADPADRPLSPYGATKRAGELFGYTYHHLYGMSIVALRFFTVYGPGQRPDLAIHKFTKLIFNNNNIPMFGDGSSKRDYTYIDDIIDGILGSINFINKSNQPVFEVFNLGRSEPVSLKKMLRTLEKRINQKAKVIRKEKQQGDMPETYANIHKASKLLSYKPKVSFKTGIDAFIKWYAEQKQHSL